MGGLTLGKADPSDHWSKTLTRPDARLAVSADSPNGGQGAATIKGCQTTGLLPRPPLALAI
jgi:hypothetical protein